jgi:cysteinyl-tRNA synthetase
MSKSLGNIISARAFMDQYHPEILKYTFLSAHYRSVLTINDDKIFQTVSALNRIYTSLLLAKDTVSDESVESQSDDAFDKKLVEFDNRIKKSLNDDFNTAEFISIIFEAVRTFNSLGVANKKKRSPAHIGASKSFLKWMSNYGQMSALFNEDPKTLLEQLDDVVIRLKDIDKVELEKLVKLRNQARVDKDWDAADKYRDELESLGIELFDGSDRGWRVKSSEN